MDITEARSIIAQQSSIVGDVLHIYVREHGCPCAWPEFEYWASKHHGPGWQDGIQNDLVDHACKLITFARSAPQPAGYAVTANYTCTLCGRVWQHLCEEWRMCAYREQLVPTVPSIAAGQFDRMVGAGCFATAGQEPSDIKSLSTIEWAQFMLGKPYKAPAPTPEKPAKPPHKLSITERIVAWLQGRA